MRNRHLSLVFVNLVGEKGILYSYLVVFFFLIFFINESKFKIFGVDFSVDFITAVIVKGNNVKMMSEGKKTKHKSFYSNKLRKQRTKYLILVLKLNICI